MEALMSGQRPVSPERVAAALNVIDPVFLGSPLLSSAELDSRTGLSIKAKLETRNPIHSFKGRGTSLFVRTADLPGSEIVAASAGNFGQGLAYCGSRAGYGVTVFASTSANTAKIEQMRRHGARIILAGADLDAAKAEARAYAREHDALFIEDGAEPSIAEGAGTIAAELTDECPDIDAIFVPLGNGALATGVGCWFKSRSPRTKVIAVAAQGAPCMVLSWQKRQFTETAAADTIADGIAVRVPVPYAVECLRDTVDDVMLVSDAEIIAAMRIAHESWGVEIEPAGAAGLAGILQRTSGFAGAKVATVLCGSNLTSSQRSTYFNVKNGGEA